MKRTKQLATYNSKQLQSFASSLVNRMQWMAQLGMQYSGARDLYKALGYTLDLNYADFYGRYLRQDIAKAIIDRPVKATWQGPLELIESKNREETAFEKEWMVLSRTLGLKTKLSRLDRLTGIGRYGVLLLGLDDVSDVAKLAIPVSPGARTLKYVKPFGEFHAKVSKYVSEPKNPRYGFPFMYEIQVADVASGKSSTVQVHHSRVIHVTDDPLESEIYGTPRLEAVYNRLMDLEKLVGGDAEMFWRGARPGYEGKVDPEYMMSAEMKEDLKDQIDEFENNLRRILINEGVELKALQQQISDPANHVDVQIQMIAAETGIPKRILTGSERGELSSAQDSSEWKDYVQARREDHAEPNIIRPLVDRLVQLKVLPSPGEDYTVKWNDLYSLSEKARVEIGKGRATALREYTYSAMAEAVLPPDAFLDICLGLTSEQITLVAKQRDALISEDKLNKAILDELKPEPPKVLPAGRPMPGGVKPAVKPVRTK